MSATGRKPNGTHFRHVGPSLRDGYRDFIAVNASLGETRPRDITQSECHLAKACTPAHRRLKIANRAVRPFELDNSYQIIANWGREIDFED